MPFLTEPIFEYEEEDLKKPFRLKNNIKYYSKKGGEIIRVMKGFKFDGATIPKVFAPLVGCKHDGRYLKAALVHDKLCITHELDWQRTHQIFKEILIESNVTLFRANLLYSAILIGGPKWS